jgi:hypothetical protein
MEMKREGPVNLVQIDQPGKPELGTLVSAGSGSPTMFRNPPSRMIGARRPQP